MRKYIIDEVEVNGKNYDYIERAAMAYGMSIEKTVSILLAETVNRFRGIHKPKHK
jgi:hypothetical protein